MSHTRHVHVYNPPPPFWGGVGLRLVAACRNSNRDMYIVCIFIRSATFSHQNTEWLHTLGDVFKSLYLHSFFLWKQNTYRITFQASKSCQGRIISSVLQISILFLKQDSGTITLTLLLLSKSKVIFWHGSRTTLSSPRKKCGKVNSVSTVAVDLGR